MAEEEKPFKTLKLTSLKTAKAAQPSPEPTPAAAVPASEPTAPAASPAVTAPAEAVVTPPPALSPSAATTGSSLRTFKLSSLPRPKEAVAPEPGTPVEGEPADSPKPAGFKTLTVASAIEPTSPEITPVSLGGSETAEPPPAIVPPIITLAAPAPSVSTGDPVAPSAPASDSDRGVTKSARAPLSKGKKVAILGGVLVPVLLIGILVVLSDEGSPPPPVVKPVPPVVKPPVVTPPVTNPPPVKTPGGAADAVKPVEPTPVVNPTPPVVDPKVPVVDPKLPVVETPTGRDAATESWLAMAEVSSVTPTRLVIDRRVVDLNGYANPEKTLTWIGRDSNTKELLFMDAAGVVYSRRVVAPVAPPPVVK